jgi:hypothetical protein
VGHPLVPSGAWKLIPVLIDVVLDGRDSLFGNVLLSRSPICIVATGRIAHRRIFSPVVPITQQATSTPNSLWDYRLAGCFSGSTPDARYCSRVENSSQKER